MTTEIVQVALDDEKTNLEHYERCARHLLNGNLVAFPTETVYGLGANALDPEAVKRIFEAKNRPLTDPVIVHISDMEMVDLFALTEFGSRKHEKSVFLHFAKTFWPGPLTQVVRTHKRKIEENPIELIKNEKGDVQASSFYGAGITDFVTAATPFVGIRMPSHSVARKLIEMTGVPIAAPSANRFGHVSPTTSKHVVEDLSNRGFEIFVLEPQKKKKLENEKQEKCCEVGIESTVAKIEQFEEDNFITVKVTLLRRGGVSFEQLTEAGKKFEAETNGILGNDEKKLKVDVVASFKKVAENTKTGEVAPGQCIRHYSPDVPSFLITMKKPSQSTESSSETSDFNSDKKFFNLKDAVIIDFENTLEWTKDKCLKYYNLSPSGSNEEAANGLFKIMRKAEKVVGAQCILLPNLMEKKSDNKKNVEDAAVFDRLFRAASGKTAYFDESGEKIQESGQI